MFPLLPTSAQSDLAGALVRSRRSSDTVEYFGDYDALAPDPIFMALRSFTNRLSQLFRRDADDEISVTPAPNLTASAVVQHPAGEQESGERLAA